MSELTAEDIADLHRHIQELEGQLAKARTGRSEALVRIAIAQKEASDFDDLVQQLRIDIANDVNALRKHYDPLAKQTRQRRASRQDNGATPASNAATSPAEGPGSTTTGEVESNVVDPDVAPPPTRRGRRPRS